MGVTFAAARRDADARAAAFIAGGLAAWLCGALAIAMAAWVIAVLVRSGWDGVLSIAASPSSTGTLAALQWSALLVGIALPAAAIASFLAGVAGAEPAIGGVAGKIVNSALRFGPAVPSVAIGAAAAAAVAFDVRLARLTDAQDIAVAAIALGAFNLPIMTARFRTVLRAVPRAWRTAAMAAGATAGTSFARIVMPRAWPGIAAVVLSGCGQMLGETAVVAMVLGAAGTGQAGPAPLSVLVWQRLALRPPEPGDASQAAAAVLALVVAIVALRFTARLLLHRKRPTGALA